MQTQIDPTSGRLHEMLVKHPFFNGLNPRYFHLLDECATFLRFGVGQYIFREGQEADHFYLIHAGKVSIETFVPLEGATTIETVVAGEALGWSWLVQPPVWHFSAKAVEPCELLALSAARLREKAEENHDFGYDLRSRVSLVMAQRLQATRRQLLEFYTPNAFQG